MADSRTVHELRKQGKIREALEMARGLIRQDNRSIWNIRAYGWSLYDAIMNVCRENPDEAAGLVDEFACLEIPPKEDILTKRRDSVTGASAQALPLLLEAGKKSRSGHHSEALQLYRRAVAADPCSRRACEGHAWEIWRKLRDISDESPSDEAASLLQEYMSLDSLDKPGEIHSRILDIVSRKSSLFPNYIPFVKWWELDNLRPQDFRKQQSESSGKTYDSLTERVIKALHRAAKNRSIADDAEWIAGFIGEHYRKYPDQEWFPYYYGCALVNTGSPEQARDIILPVVTAKSGEFWAWDLLADTCPDPLEKKACLCKSLLCRVRSDSFRVNVHSRLGQLLRHEGCLPQAKHEYCTALSLREKQGWKIPADLDRVRHEDWFRNTQASESNIDLYRRFSPLADKLAVQGLPQQQGIVTHVNSRKGVVRVAFSRTDFCLLYTDRLPGASQLSVGDTVCVKAIDTPGNGKKNAVWFRPSDTSLQDADFCEPFCGKITIKGTNPFGFVGDCYVSPQLIRANGIHDKDMLSGYKIQEWNEQKSRNTWAAVTVRKEKPGS